MADRCAGCMNKFKRFEKPHMCPECHRNFCSICLPGGEHGKKSKQQVHAQIPEREVCVYCSRKQKQVNLKEETEILENFKERFYKHAHTEPPVQTKVQLDRDKVKPAEIGGVARAEPQLSEQDRLLEERLRRLKESHKTDVHTHSDDEIKQKLARLRGEEESRDSASNAPAQLPDKTTQFEQATDLMKEAADEVKLDEKLAEMNRQKEEDLHNRFQALMGRESAASKQPTSDTIGKSNSEIQQFLEDLEIEITEEDPEALLQDLSEYQKKTEGHAFAELRSSGLIAKVGEVDKEGKLDTSEVDPLSRNVADIAPYPVLPGGVDPSETPRLDLEKKNQAEIAKLIGETEEEIAADKQREEKKQDFLREASERLAELRAKDGTNTSDANGRDCIVRSKPKDSLSFTWEHFGPPKRSDVDAPAMSSSVHASAARQLGITDSVELPGGEGRDIDDDVKLLLEQMMAEAALEDKLEAGGYGHYLDESGEKGGDKRAEKGDQKSAMATAAGGYTSWGKEDEFPWCCICNNDAVLRCQECDGDLYCQRCFSEGHEQFGLFDHHYTLYEQPARRNK